MTFDVSFPGLGIDVTVNRVAFHLFGLPIYWYGVIIGFGMLLAILFTFFHHKRFGLNADRMTDVIILSAVCAILSARAYYVIFAPFEYESIWQMLDIRDGGLAIYGGVLGAFLFGSLICKWRKVPLLPMYDITALGFLLGQGIGRWGNFVNQEAFGGNTAMPWGMISNGTTNYLLRHQAELAQQGITVDPFMPVHPTFFYESLWCLIGFGLLWWYSYHRKFDGELIALYCVWYGAERAVVEGLRTDSLMWGPIRVSQALAVVLVLFGLVVLLYGRKKAKEKRAAGLPVLYVETHPDPDVEKPAPAAEKKPEENAADEDKKEE